MPAEDICTKQTQEKKKKKINILLFARCIFRSFAVYLKFCPPTSIISQFVDLCVHNIACYFIIILQLSLFPFAYTVTT